MVVIQGPWADPGAAFEHRPHDCAEDTMIDAEPCDCCGELHVRCLVCGSVVVIEE